MPYQTHAIETPKESQLHILVFSPEYIPDFYAKTKDFALSDPVITIDSSVAKQLYYPLFETDSLYLRKSALYQVLYLLNTKRLYYQPKIKRISLSSYLFTSNPFQRRTDARKTKQQYRL